MLRLLIIIVLSVFSARASAQLIKHEPSGVFMDKKNIREHQIKTLTITLHIGYRKRPWQKFKNDIYAKQVLYFNQNGDYTFSINHHYAKDPAYDIIDTFRFETPAVHNDSLFYNSHGQVIKALDLRSKDVTFFRYDSLGRKVYSFHYDSLSMGFGSTKKFEICQYTFDDQGRETTFMMKQGYFYNRDTTAYIRTEKIIYSYDSTKLLTLEGERIDFSIRRTATPAVFTMYYDYANGIPIRIRQKIEKGALFYPEILINVTECEPIEWGK